MPTSTHNTIPQPDRQPGLSRRDFLLSVGGGALLASLTACTGPNILGGGEKPADLEAEAREKAFEIASAILAVGKNYLSDQLPAKIDDQGLMRIADSDAGGKLEGGIGFGSQSTRYSGVDLVMERYDPQHPGIDNLPTRTLIVVFRPTDKYVAPTTYADQVALFEKTLASGGGTSPEPTDSMHTGVALSEVSVLFGEENGTPRKYSINFGSEGMYLDYERNEAGKQLASTDSGFASALRDTTERLTTELATLSDWVKTAQ